MAFVAGDGLIVGRDFRSRAGSAADSTYVVAFWHPDRADSVSRDFVARYRARFGQAPADYECAFSKF